MEVSFENKTIGAYRELLRTSRVIQENAETVVPDINDDIGRIASVQTAVFLKSKDLTGRAAIVTGEISATLIYITENEKNISFLRISKPFTMDLDTSELPADAVTQIKLRIQHTEARVFNPRKVQLSFEVIGDLSCYAAEMLISESLLPQDLQTKIHAKYETVDIPFVKIVMEKTFAVNEQYIFTGGKPVPCRIIAHNVEMTVNETQIIGTKLIIKGNVFVSVLYMSDEVNYPIKMDFTSPFSQIVDTGIENLDSSDVVMELTSSYCDLIDTISGEKAADIEIHALLEILGCKRERISYVSDAYCNICPVQCCVDKKQFTLGKSAVINKLSADERINVADDCADVLSIFTSLSQIAVQSEKIQAAVTLDIIYRTVNGNTSSVRRLVGLESECAATNARISAARIVDAYLRPDGNAIDCHLSAEISVQCGAAMEISSLGSVSLDEENCFDLNDLPSLYLVRAEKESLWELAKAYHSSIECIADFNELDDAIEGRMILIPRSI